MVQLCPYLVLPLLPQVEPAGGTWGLSSAQGRWGKELFMLAVVIFHLAGGEEEIKQVKWRVAKKKKKFSGDGLVEKVEMHDSSRYSCFPKQQ